MQFFFFFFIYKRDYYLHPDKIKILNEEKRQENEKKKQESIKRTDEDEAKRLSLEKR